jgi:anti-sigma B factor antagonist
MESFFNARQQGGYTVVEFQTDSLTHPLEIERIGQALYRLVEQDGKRSLLLDFTPVKYLSSQAIGIILTLNKKLSQFPNSAVVLCGVGPQLMQLLKITRLDQILKIVPNQAEALKK